MWGEGGGERGDIGGGDNDKDNDKDNEDNVEIIGREEEGHEEVRIGKLVLCFFESVGLSALYFSTNSLTCSNRQMSWAVLRSYTRSAPSDLK